MKPVYIETWSEAKEQFASVGKANWSVPRLIELSKELEVIEIPLQHLNLDYQISYRPREFVMHMRAALDADLKYPIILDEDGSVMDGRHRILKALHLNKKTIKAVRFDVNPYPCKVDE